MGDLVLEATNYHGKQTVTLEHVGALVLYSDECRKVTSYVAEEIDKIRQSTLVDLTVIARDGEMPNVPLYDAHGTRQYNDEHWAYKR